MCSAFCALIQADVPETGEAKLFRVLISASIINVLSQFAGLMSMMLLFPFFHTFESAWETVSLNTALSILLLSNISAWKSQGISSLTNCLHLLHCALVKQSLILILSLLYLLCKCQTKLKIITGGKWRLLNRCFFTCFQFLVLSSLLM